jgi:hypothetical protein
MHALVDPTCPSADSLLRWVRSIRASKLPYPNEKNTDALYGCYSLTSFDASAFVLQTPADRVDYILLGLLMFTHIASKGVWVKIAPGNFSKVIHQSVSISPETAKIVPGLPKLLNRNG